MNSSAANELLNEWKTQSSILRIVAGGNGVGFDTLCKIKNVSSEK
jgi:hypothetical protein